MKYWRQDEEETEEDEEYELTVEELLDDYNAGNLTFEGNVPFHFICFFSHLA